MILNLNELDRNADQTLSLKGNIDMSSLRHQDVISFENFHFDGQASKESKLIRVIGTITGILKVKCSRCIIPVDYSFSIPFDEQFGEGPVEEESDIHSYQGVTIDLLPFLHEVIFLELPHVFVCDESCEGLCPTCGVNRNENRCQCKNERIDPRLADLALFFEKNKH